jgi:hypothetical protein
MANLFVAYVYGDAGGFAFGNAVIRDVTFEMDAENLAKLQVRLAQQIKDQKQDAGAPDAVTVISWQPI